MWFEPLFVKILKHEYAASMRFDVAAQARQPSPPVRPCQLYVHIPFCESLCPFCSFHRVQFRDTKSQGYFEALRREIRAYHERGFQFRDVYVGGGTPTVAPGELVSTVELLRSLWPIKTLSVETNPNHLREEMFRVLESLGVDRLSVGVQSFDDSLLRQMQRYERYGSGAAIRDRLAAAQGRFRTLNVDMIFNLPNQTLAMLDADLEALLDLEVDQVSFYPLMTAPAARRKMERTLGSAQEQRRSDFYARILEAMRERYRPASAWCFSRIQAPAHSSAPGSAMIDEYIVDHDDYIGVGSGAFSYVDGWMYSTTFSINQYRQRLAQGLSAITRSKQLTTRQRMRYDFLVRLFGLSLSREFVRRKYGRGFWLRMAPELLAMRLIGATRHDAAGIHLTDAGMYCWVLMMAEFFNAVNAFREQMRQHIRAELDEWLRPEVAVPLDAIGRTAKGTES